MLPRCRTTGEPFVIPTFDVQVSDVEGFMDEPGVKPRSISWITWWGNTAPLPGNLSSRWLLLSRGAVSAACNAF